MLSGTITLTPRLIDQPELTHTPNGVSKCEVRVVVDHPAKDGRQKKSEYYTIYCWNKLAEELAKFAPQTPLVVAGTLEQQQWTNKDGEQRQAYKIRVSYVGINIAMGGVSFAKAQKATAPTDSELNEIVNGANDTPQSAQQAPRPQTRRPQRQPAPQAPANPTLLEKPKAGADAAVDAAEAEIAAEPATDTNVPAFDLDEWWPEAVE